MRIIDLHCYPSTQEWIDCQGPYVEALAKYWKRDWVAKTENEVIGALVVSGVWVACYQVLANISSSFEPQGEAAWVIQIIGYAMYVAWFTSLYLL